MRRRLQAILDRPLVLAVAFLCLIPTFATLYAALLPAGSFYDANLKREPSHGVDRGKLQDALADAMRSEASAKPWKSGGPRFGEGDLPTEQAVVPASLQVYDLSISRGTATFTVRGVIVVSVLTGHERDFAPLVEVISANIRTAISGGSRLAPPTVMDVTAGSSSNPLLPFELMPLRRLFDSFVLSAPRGATGTGHLLVPNTVYSAIQRYENAEDGDPSAASSRWLRMLYFSVVAVTTLGFGDITPVTTAARTCVTAEALLGVILIGLFLNALAPRAGARRRYVPPRDRT